MNDRDLDLVIYGATGFAGRLVAEHVARHAPRHLRVGLGGRSVPRLYETRAHLPGRGQTWGFVVADATDPTGVARLARSARVVATTVGPYARYGAALAAACAEAGTHYVDLTGEVLFMRRSIEANDAVARRTGAAVVHACGFDSVPSDLGVWSVHRHAAATGAGDLTRVTGLLTGARGGISGGTIDSMRAQLEEAAATSGARRIVADPHALDIGTTGVPRPGPRDRFGVAWDARLGYWLAPFVMAPVNTRVVRRSQALLDGAYGAGFRYREAVGARGRIRGAGPALATSAGTAALVAGMTWPPTRRLLDRVLPAPGAGPSQRTRDRGYFRFRHVAQTSSGRVLTARLGADLDPGYGATAVMLGEAAMALAADEGTGRAGVLTPATALGDAFVERLRRAGFHWDVTG
ncbi:MAG: saccharopine dehydrogenase family protein [Kineosporiaceae bacterium]